MEIPLNAQVECTDGVCGHSAFILINPVLKEVSHLVVKDITAPHKEYLVPVNKVAETMIDTIQLTCNKAELAAMEPFIVKRYISEKVPGRSIPDIGSFAAGAVFYLPYASSKATLTSEIEDEQIPPGELPVYRGTGVEATDGPIGKVDEFIVNPENCHITHLVMREGHLWGKKDVIIPISAIDKAFEDVVYLSLNKKQIAALPAVPLHRLWD
jgi:hypothetical protein